MGRMQALEKTLRWVIIAGIFALPFICLLVTTSLFFPYITGKNFAFRGIVELITGAWLALSLVSVKYRPRRSWILGALALFVLIMAIADAQGVLPFKSFWSNYERMDGWVTLVHVLALTVVAASVLSTEKLWRRFWQVSLCVSMFVALYGFLQIFGALALGEGGIAGLSARIDATFGNPIYLAVYMLFHIFMAAILWVQMRAQRPREEWLPFTLWYGSAIVLDALALLFTGTRGTTLGLIGGALLAFLIYSFTPDASRRLRQYSIGAIIAVAVLGGGLWAARDTAFVQNIGFLDRLSTISLQDATTKSRLLNAHIAWQGVKERPILGWGQENYAIVFDKYYDPAMYGQEPWFDRVHDVIFDWWIAGGTIGLLAYLSIFAAAMWMLWRRKSAFTYAEKSLLTGLLGGYFFHNLFVFDNVTSYILFAFTLAYISWRGSAGADAPYVPQRASFPYVALPFVTVACAILVWGVAWFVNANALAANRTLLSALEQQPAGVSQNLALMEQAISYGTYGTQEAREQLAQMATQVAQAQVDLSVKQQFFDTAITQMKQQQAASPLDARFPLFLGILEDAYGDYKDASTSLEQAHELSPDKQAILYQVGLNQQAQGQTAAAVATFKHAYELDTDDRDALLSYAAASITAKDDATADKLLAPLIATGAAADTRVTSAYASRNEFSKIVALWIPYVKANPTDAQGYFTLAAAYAAEGDTADAVATLKAVEIAVPSTTAQAESLIQQVQNGTAKVQ